MCEVYISMRHTPLSMYYAGWIEKGLGSNSTKVLSGFNQIRKGKFSEGLANRIEKCRNFIVILTPDTFGQEDDNDNWMVCEIEVALKAKANIIPVVSKDFVWPKTLPDRIKEIKNFTEVIMAGNKMLSSDYEEIMLSLREISNRLLEDNKKDVFISYSSKEMQIAKKIKQKLEFNNISCWMAPDSIPAGSDYANEIYKAIKGCEICLVILSKNSQISKWVPKEIDIAINEDLIVIPYQIDDANMDEKFEFRLINCQKIIAYNREKEALQELTNVVLDILNK